MNLVVLLGVMGRGDVERKVHVAMRMFFDDERYEVSYESLIGSEMGMATVKKDGRWIGEVFYEYDDTTGEYITKYTLGGIIEDEDRFSKVIEYFEEN